MTVNHSIGFKNLDNGAHTNTIESTWRHVKVLMNQYCRKSNYIYALADYMFRKKCTAERVDPSANSWILWLQSTGPTMTSKLLMCVCVCVQLLFRGVACSLCYSEVTNTNHSSNNKSIQLTPAMHVSAIRILRPTLKFHTNRGKWCHVVLL